MDSFTEIIVLLQECTVQATDNFHVTSLRGASSKQKIDFSSIQRDLNIFHEIMPILLNMIHSTYLLFTQFVKRKLGSVCVYDVSL